MTATEPQAASAKPKRRWYQYSLRTLLLLMLVASIAMSWLSVRRQRAKAYREAIEAIQKEYGSVAYDWQVAQTGARPQPPAPEWLRKLLGDDFFGDVVRASVQTDSAMEQATTFSGLSELGVCVFITDEGLAHLKSFPRLRKLTMHDIAAITDAGLANLKDATEVESLYFRDVHVGDSGLKHLDGLTQLQTLHLQDTGITDAGLAHIKTFTQLQSLHLREGGITDAGVKDLQNALPNCTIVFSRKCPPGEEIEFYPAGFSQLGTFR